MTKQIISLENYKKELKRSQLEKQMSQQNHALSMIAPMMHTTIVQAYPHWNHNYKVSKMKVTLTPIK